ncbi:MAG: hypothetical protein PF637_07255 [Spirochaetes bacterium]|jgi:hypothetical protein|nr:hypothetical protein [Spirochaetota bacterium]
MVDVKNIDDRMLKDFLLMGKETFRVGVYEQYLEEAKFRDIDLTFMSYMDSDNKKTRTIRDMFSMKNLFP